MRNRNEIIRESMDNLKTWKEGSDNRRNGFTVVAFILTHLLEVLLDIRSLLNKKG